MQSPCSPDLDDTFPMLAPTLRPLAACGVLKRFRKGQRLIEEGDTGETIFIITKGRVRAFSSGDRGREITYGVYGAGEYIGEMSLDGGPRSATVDAVEACECMLITRQTLLQHIAQHPEFALELIAKVIRRARAMTLSTKQLALNDAYGRLVLILNEMSTPQGDGTRTIDERLTHLELSQRLGCGREMVSRLMKSLEDGGYVQRTPDGGLRMLRPLPARW